MQAGRVGRFQHAAARDEECCIGARHRTGIADRDRVAPMYRAGNAAGEQAGLQAAQRGVIEQIIAEAVGSQFGRPAGRQIEAFLRAIELDPAFAAHQGLGTGRLRPAPVLIDAALDQGQDGAAEPVEPVRGRVPPVAREPGRHPQQGRRAVAHGDGAVRGEGGESREIAGKGIGNDGRALDQPGIAMAGFGSRLAAIDQQDGAAALLQMQGGADADDAGPEHDDIRLSCRHRQSNPSPKAHVRGIAEP